MRKTVGRATIKDVAAQAGVTNMTVSRVLNSSGAVSTPVRERVMEAVRALGYTPSRLARGLRLSRTNTLALVVTDVTNPFFTTIARGVEDAASDRDNLILLCNTDESEAEELRYIKLLAGQGVDGVLLVPARTGRAAFELAASTGVAMVMLDRRVPMENVSVVRCDSKLGAQEMAKYLLTLGHREFSILAGPIGVPTSDDRVGGFLEALEGTRARANVINGMFSTQSGQESVSRAMGMTPRPTALFALNNFITIGALQELNKKGIRVPEDVALVGFDDLPSSMVSQPFLTVVAQPAYEMGRRAVEVLLAELSEPGGHHQEVIMPVELVIRRSSGDAIV